MAGAIHLRVLTEAGLALEEQADSVIAPGERGYLGFLRHHAPLVTTVSPGALTWRTGEGLVRVARVGAGLLEILHDRLTLLTDSVQLLENNTSFLAARKP